MVRYIFSTVLQKLWLHLYDTILAIRYLLLSIPIKIMWLYIWTLIILWTLFWYPWICPAVHRHSRGDWKEWNKLFSCICISISKEYAHGFICFVVFILRIGIALMWLTRIFQDWVPCNVVLVPLPNYQLSMTWVNLIIRRQQLNKSSEHTISITCTICRLYCIYMAYSQLMRYQLYEQNICVCIFIRTKMMMPFPFIKRVSILAARQNIQHDENMTNIFFRILLV